MRLSRVLGISLVTVLTVATVATAQLAPGGTFSDDDGSVHEADIEAIAAEGITKGCNPPDNTLFCPGDPVTRGQMAAFLVRALNYTDDGGGDHFTDDDGSIFEQDIDRLHTAGVTVGCNPPTNDRYCPDSSVTRGQMAAFLVRAMNYTDDGGGDHFTDDDGSVFEADIDRLATAGVTLGCNPPTNDQFCPNAEVTREQMASFLTRALGLTPIPPPPPTSSTSSTSTTLPSGNSCTGALGAVSIDDDLTVPSGATCDLAGTTVEGNVIVASGATLEASGVSVDGNVQADGQAAVTVDSDSFVGGDVQVENGAAASVSSSDIDGNIQIEANAGAIIVTDNIVGGDIQVNSNTGGAVITDNVVDGNLQCESNNPAPTGGGNTVAGNKEGQCSGL
ncbi:MAG TPA: S-layer homology domain-containing protein [Acidimicrobiia bacterium]|nr:S-layer homology domain-containing protein [Acidimicrobiia bacterium]